MLTWPPPSPRAQPALRTGRLGWHRHLGPFPAAPTMRRPTRPLQWWSLARQKAAPGLRHPRPLLGCGGKHCLRSRAVGNWKTELMAKILPSLVVPESMRPRAAGASHPGQARRTAEVAPAPLEPPPPAPAPAAEAEGPAQAVDTAPAWWHRHRAHPVVVAGRRPWGALAPASAAGRRRPCAMRAGLPRLGLCQVRNHVVRPPAPAVPPFCP